MTETRTTLREHEGDLVVEAVDHVADDVVAVTLADPGGEALPPWTPGAHVDLILEPDLVRQYSLCGSPSDSGTIRVAVLKAPGGRGGSAFVHERLHAGSVGARPRAAQPFPAGRLAPLPVHRGRHRDHPAAADDRRGRARRAPTGPCSTAGRSRASMAFVDELAPYADRVTLVPQDELGVLDLDNALGEPRDDTLVYCCGPEGLLAAVEQRCAVLAGRRAAPGALRGQAGRGGCRRRSPSSSSWPAPASR